MRKMTVFLTFLNHCFPNRSKTMMLKTKVDIHVFSAVEIFLWPAITRTHYFRHRTKCLKQAEKFGYVGTGSSWVQPVLSLAQGHNTVPPVRLEPTTPWSRTLKSSTLPLIHCAPHLSDLIDRQNKMKLYNTKGLNSLFSIPIINDSYVTVINTKLLTTAMKFSLSYFSISIIVTCK